MDQDHSKPTSATDDRYERTQVLIADLRRRAETCEDPREQANLRRSADSLVRLAKALRP